MNGGQGPYSYDQNSALQGSSVYVTKSIIEREVTTKLDVKQLHFRSPNRFCIADFGCSTGNNSFQAMQNVIEAVEKRFQTQLGFISGIPEFQVYFNDQVSNDFKTLFHSLQHKKRYYAAGVPGSFHARLFPRSSLHFVYSSWSLQWLSKLPKAIGNPERNKGKLVHYREDRTSAGAFFDAYSNQFATDIESFLEVRAQEMVGGGLMTIIIPAVSDSWNPEISYGIPTGFSLLGSCLMDLANEGKLSEAKVESFSLPLYFPTPQELKSIMERSDSFCIERMEVLKDPGSQAWSTAKAAASCFRSAFEGLLTNHFGIRIIDELFNRCIDKFSTSSLFLNPDKDGFIL